MRFPDLYVILEVGRTSSGNDIKRAFQKLARRYHPDINPGDRAAQERFKAIAQAYEILSDPEKRLAYDANGFSGGTSREKAVSEWTFSFQQSDLHGSDSSGAASVSMADIFDDFFVQAPPRDPEKGSDIEAQMSLSFEDSIKGVKARLSVVRKSICTTCHNTSSGRAGLREQVCTTCDGTGKVARFRGHLQFLVKCADCRGLGREPMSCEICNGEGRLTTSEIIEVDVPPGVSSGSRIKVGGKGDAGRYGGPPGDLYVVTAVAHHPFFTRIGDNIHCTVPLSITEAALGAKLEVPTIDGIALARIPPGTQTGQIFRIRGKGAPSLMQPGMRGDQYIQVTVVVPRVADERSKEILRELARLNAQDLRRDLWSKA